MRTSASCACSLCYIAACVGPVMLAVGLLRRGAVLAGRVLVDLVDDSIFSRVVARALYYCSPLLDSFLTVLVVSVSLSYLFIRFCLGDLQSYYLCYRYFYCGDRQYRRGGRAGRGYGRSLYFLRSPCSFSWGLVLYSVMCTKHMTTPGGIPCVLSW